MELTHNLLWLGGACIALFLAGANIAFILTLRRGLVSWFKFKFTAIALLLIYVATSLSFGNPAAWRGILGVAAVSIDLVALIFMWLQIENQLALQVKGFLPLIDPRKEKLIHEREQAEKAAKVVSGV